LFSPAVLGVVESEVVMKLRLVVQTEGKMQGQGIDVKLAQFVIGRDPQCHLRPASPLISKRHCAIVQRDGKAFVHDFDSTNGTFLNDAPVKGEVQLSDGDKLKVGPILFEVRLEVAAPKPAAEKTPAARTIKTPTAPTLAARPDAPAQPAKKAVAATAAASSTPAEGGADDDAAAMLLAMQDDSDAPSGLSTTGTADLKVPDGSTVHEIEIPPDVQAEGGKPGQDKHAQAKAQQANTSSAAKSILEKYLKRPR
jgi:predicted component of type VI protein secretion system